MIERLIATPEFLLSCVGFIVWLVRVEGKLKYAEAALEKLEAKHDALYDRIVEKLSLIEKSLSKIEGQLSVSGKEEG